MPRVPKVKPDYECTDCNLKFGRKHEYDRHMDRHAPNREELLHRCLVAGCKYGTLQQSNLKSHTKAVHEKLRDYKCTVCDATFGDNSARIRHESRVHGILAQGRKKNRNQTLGAPTTTRPRALRKATKTSDVRAEEAIVAPESNLATIPASSPTASSSSSSSLGSVLPTPILGGDYAYLGTPLPTSSASSPTAYSSSSVSSALLTPVLGEGNAYLGTPLVNDDSVSHDGQNQGLNLTFDHHQGPAARTAVMEQEEILVKAYYEAYNGCQTQVRVAPGLWQDGQTDVNTQGTMHVPPYDGCNTTPVELSLNNRPVMNGNTNGSVNVANDTYYDFINSVPNHFSHNDPYTLNSDASVNAYGTQPAVSSSSTALPVQMYAAPYQQGQAWSSLHNWNGAFD